MISQVVHIKTRLDLLGIKTFKWDQRLQIQNFFMALGQQYNVGEKPTVILYTVVIR